MENIGTLTFHESAVYNGKKGKIEGVKRENERILETNRTLVNDYKDKELGLERAIKGLELVQKRREELLKQRDKVKARVFNKKPKLYIANCSFGKDSIATILLALEHNEPLDRVVFCEVMFDHEKGISGELPEHIEWIYNVAIPKLAEMGVKVDIVRAKKDYVQLCNTIYKKGNNIGFRYGFQSGGVCHANSELKIQPIRSYCSKFKKNFDVVQYVGIAVDEPKRLKRLEGTNKVSLLLKYGYTEAMAMDKCREYGLVSPCYSIASRGGCWFCANAKLPLFIHIRKNYPVMWNELRELDKIDKRIHYKFKYGKTLQEVEKEMDAYEWQQEKQLTLF